MIAARRQARTPGEGLEEAACWIWAGVKGLKGVRNRGRVDALIDVEQRLLAYLILLANSNKLPGQEQGNKIQLRVAPKGERERAVAAGT